MTEIEAANQRNRIMLTAMKDKIAGIPPNCGRVLF